MWTVSNWKLELSVAPFYLNLNTCFLGNYLLEIWFLKEIISSSHEKNNWNYLKNSVISIIFITSCFFLLSVGMIDLVTQRSANYLIYSSPKQGTIWRPTILFLITFLITFCFYEDCHESSGCSIAHAGSRSIHICEYVTPLFCMLNYYFNHFQGNKFFKKTQSNGDVLLG